MDIKRLRVFVAVVEEGGFSAAARKLHMAQPAVSIAIRTLEEELHVELFDASARRKQLTYEGERLLLHAREVLRQVEQLENELRGLSGTLVSSRSPVPPCWRPTSCRTCSASS